MPEENLDKTRAEPDLEIVSTEQILLERDERIKQLEETTRLAQMERDRAAQEDAERLRAIRIKLFGQGEAGVIAGRYAVEIPEETMRDVQRDIRTEVSKRAGVLGTGEAASESRDAEYRMAGRSAASETSFVGTNKNEGEDRAESMSTGMSLAELTRRDAEQRSKPSSRAKSALRLSDIGAAKGSGLVPDDLDVDAMFNDIVEKDKKNEKAA